MAVVVHDLRERRVMYLERLFRRACAIGDVDRRFEIMGVRAVFEHRAPHPFGIGSPVIAMLLVFELEGMRCIGRGCKHMAGLGFLGGVAGESNDA